MKRKAYLKLHTSIFLYGFTGIFGKLISLSELPLVWYRVAITSIAFWLMYKRRMPKVAPRHRGLILLCGLILAVHWLTFFASIKLSNVSIAMVCFSTGAVFLALLNPLIYRQKRLSFTELLLSIVTVTGVSLIFAFEFDYLAGIIVGLVAAITNAIWSLVLKRLVGRYPPQVLNYYQMLIGWAALSAYLLLTMLITGELAFPIPDAWDWLYLVLLSVVCTNIAYGLSLAALKHIPAFSYLIAVNLEPIYSIILAFFIFGENKDLNWGFLVGAVLVLLSVFLLPVIERLQQKKRSFLDYPNQ